MRILQIISSPSAGGAEMYVKDLCINLAKNNYDVFILFVSHASEINCSEEFELKYINELIKHNVKFDFIGNFSKKNPFIGILKVKDIVRSFSPDIIHSHLYYGALFSLFISKKIKIYTHHNIRLRASKHIYKLLDLGISCYIGICDACTVLLKKHTCKEVVKINNGVDLSRIKYAFLDKEDISSRVDIFMAGRLVEQKNYKLIFDSLILLKDLNFHLTIAGEGPERDYLEDYVKHIGMQEKVTFLGNCSNVNEIMRKMDIFAMCSAWEGLPIALIEATLTGLPVIVTNVGGCAEIVNTAKNGFIVEDLNVDSYHKALRHMISSSELRKKFHQNALNNSISYTIDDCVKNHIELYKRYIFK